MPVPVIDLFAGPGGLGEGLSRASRVDFRTVISIEKDEMAACTLRLRAAHRALRRSLAGMPAQQADGIWATWDRVIAESDWRGTIQRLSGCGIELITRACQEAAHEALKFELGPDRRAEVTRLIRERLEPYMQDGQLPDNAVLIGGPPCQAYSLVGRARNRGKEDYRPEEDHRHFLYKEYLQVIAEFRPAVFVMENVKGILTSTVEGAGIFESIKSDLRHPGRICDIHEDEGYVLVSLVKGADGSLHPIEPAAEEFIVRTELLGLPQARHRVIICGIREDVFERAGRRVGTLMVTPPTDVRDVIVDLPKLRPALSWRGGGASWLSSFKSPMFDEAIVELQRSDDPDRRWVATRMLRAVAEMTGADPLSGAERLKVGLHSSPNAHRAWYADRTVRVLANHESRSHMPEDLVRYLFVSAYGQQMEMSPRLSDFPMALLPNHRNVDPENVSAAIFKDRFRVQVFDSHSTTVTSHIGKDGHAFIHPDPAQCRSLTVREAARLQTFSDSYVFLGNRTSQYTQVGNAVPPMLATRIGDVIGEVLFQAKMAEAHLAGSESDPERNSEEILL
jgi:DNA (cytosine-5)-methyltransferase 1